MTENGSVNVYINNMSGGRYEYKQHHIQDIIDHIELGLRRQGTEKSKHDLWYTGDYYKDHPEELLFETYPEEVQQIMRDGVKALKIAYVYAHHIDYYLSADYGEDTLVNEIKKDLEKINNQNP